jgi:hypothetical protein
MDTPNSPKPPELETEPAGEANTTVSITLPTNDVVESLQTEIIQPPAEPILTPETPQTEALSEPIPETPTAQMGRNEPLPEAEPAPETPSAEVSAEAPEIETPTQSEPETLTSVTSEETPPKAEESPRTQQGTVQPEPQPTPASPPESLPAQAPIIAIPAPQNIVGLILTKARLMIQLRKQKKLLKIMPLFTKKNSITNDDVEKLLHVSDATATRYLSELEKQGKIKQTGKTGHAVTYSKI